MADGAAWLVEQVLPHRPILQWVLSLPFPLRFMLATHPALTNRASYRFVIARLAAQVPPPRLNPGSSPGQA
ncbi:MAG: hypothetical protein Tsb0027_14570 [Wenzhouxiangellaceae bacterium]